MGQRVKTLVARSIPSGVHKISWDGKSMNGKEVASGLYIAKAIGDDFNFQKENHFASIKPKYMISVAIFGYGYQTLLFKNFSQIVDI